MTVVADTCARADAWATALNVLGPEHGPAAANAAGVQFLLYSHADDGFEELASRGFPPAEDLR